MGYSLKRKTRQKLRLKTSLAVVTAALSLAGIIFYLLPGILSLIKEEVPARSLLIDDHAGDKKEPEVQYTWENGEVGIPEIGPGAIKYNPSAKCISGGAGGGKGLSAGTGNKGIDLVLSPLSDMDPAGIDISMDYKRLEESCTFISRGKDFHIGMKEGIIMIRYKLSAPNGKTYLVDARTGYEIPSDHTFRSIRFIYNPSSGKGELLVDGNPVWTNHAPADTRISWNKESPFIVGTQMTGGGSGMAILDNLIIHKIGQKNPAPLRLLSFTAEPAEDHIMLNWFTAAEKGTDYFIIEKSEDTKSYKEIGRVKASWNSDQLKAYALVDKDNKPGIYYYRLSLSNHGAHTDWVPVIALRIKPPPVQSAHELNWQPPNSLINR